jgi:hypothetical protein
MPQWVFQPWMVGSLLAAVFLLGAIGFLYGWFGDRSRGRPRCPKCWYDMRGRPLDRPPVCPECGHPVGTEARLYHDRHRWRLMAAGALASLACVYPTCVLLGWSHERPAIARIAQLGARITVVRSGPRWLVDRLPNGLATYFDRADGVFVIGPPFAQQKTPLGDPNLPWVAKLWNLRQLNLTEVPGLTDAGVAQLSGLIHLEDLHLSHTAVGDAGVAHWRGLTNLRLLDLSATRITDAGLAHLSGMTKLESLYVRDTAITDAGVNHLSGLVNLKALTFCNTKITDAACITLARLPKLQTLDLRATRVGDAGVATLAQLPDLRELYLLQNPITDASVTPVLGMKRLTLVQLGGISEAAMNRLRQLRPELDADY